jgi:ankyrin repeat protein
VDGITVPYCVGNPLIRALKYGYEKAVQALADHGADFNLRSPGMRCSTALEVAATDRVEPGLIERLLQAGHFDLNLVDSKGRTIVSQ